MRVPGYTISNFAQLHKALGDETRLRILHLLAHRGELCVCDIEAILRVSQSKASRHLNHLKQAGIVRDRREGTWVYYRVARDAPAPVRSAIRQLKQCLTDDERAVTDLARAARVDPAACAPVAAAGGGRR